MDPRRKRWLIDNAKPPRRTPPPAPRLTDPSRTGGLASALAVRLRAIFNALAADAMAWVRGGPSASLPGGVNDPFKPVAPSAVGNSWTPQEPDRGRLDRFRSWLRSRLGSSLVGKQLVAEYLAKAYGKGADRSFRELRKGTRRSGAERLARLPQAGTEAAEGFTRQMILRGATGGKIELLAGRSYAEMEGVTASMSVRMGRVLADSLASSWSLPRTTAALRKEVGISLSRALLVARTELVRAHAEGQLDAAEELGSTHVEAAVEWITAGDSKVCPQCKPMQGTVTAIADARGLIPRHPNCRCAWVPLARPQTAVPPGERAAATGASVLPPKRKPVGNAATLPASEWLSLPETIIKRRRGPVADPIEDEEENLPDPDEPWVPIPPPPSHRSGPPPMREPIQETPAARAGHTTRPPRQYPAEAPPAPAPKPRPGSVIVGLEAWLKQAGMFKEEEG